MDSRASATPDVPVPADGGARCVERQAREQADALLAEARRTTSLSARADLFQEAERLLDFADDIQGELARRTDKASRV